MGSMVHYPNEVTVLDLIEHNIINNHPAFPFHPRPARHPSRVIRPNRIKTLPYLPKRNYPNEIPGKAKLTTIQLMQKAQKPGEKPTRPGPDKPAQPIPGQPDKPIPKERPDQPYQPDQPSKPDQPMHPERPQTPNQPVAKQIIS
jgi:hypothetical protein